MTYIVVNIDYDDNDNIFKKKRKRNMMKFLMVRFYFVNYFERKIEISMENQSLNTNERRIE